MPEDDGMPAAADGRVWEESLVNGAEMMRLDGGLD